LDIGPLSKGHSLIIPKCMYAPFLQLHPVLYGGTHDRYGIDHSEKLDGVPDEYLADTLPLAKKIAIALGAENYNVLQNNGAIAHQVVKHVHFHVIPKPSASDDDGLVIGWPAKDANKDELKAFWEQLKGKL
jgi:diadenosine tetraphosphate (Ap4A) HIT family hydrolase